MPLSQAPPLTRGIGYGGTEPYRVFADWLPFTAGWAKPRLLPSRDARRHGSPKVPALDNPCSTPRAGSGLLIVAYWHPTARSCAPDDLAPSNRRNRTPRR
jgi:hypothetical protein